MANSKKDDEGDGESRSIRTSSPERPHRPRRFSSAEITQMFTDLFIVVGHIRNMEVPPSLLAAAIGRLAAVLGHLCDIHRDDFEPSPDTERNNDS